MTSIDDMAAQGAVFAPSDADIAAMEETVQSIELVVRVGRRACGALVSRKSADISANEYK